MKVTFEKLEDKHIPGGCYRTMDKGLVLKVIDEQKEFKFITSIGFTDNFDKFIEDLNVTFQHIEESLSE